MSVVIRSLRPEIGPPSPGPHLLPVGYTPASRLCTLHRPGLIRRLSDLLGRPPRRRVICSRPSTSPGCRPSASKTMSSALPSGSPRSHWLWPVLHHRQPPQHRRCSLRGPGGVLWRRGAGAATAGAAGVGARAGAAGAAATAATAAVVGFGPAHRSYFNLGPCHRSLCGGQLRKALRGRHAVSPLRPPTTLCRIHPAAPCSSPTTSASWRPARAG